MDSDELGEDEGEKEGEEEEEKAEGDPAEAILAERTLTGTLLRTLMLVRRDLELPPPGPRATLPPRPPQVEVVITENTGGLELASRA